MDQVFWWVFFALLALAIWRYGAIPDGGLQEHLITFLVLFSVSFLVSIPVRFVVQALR
jgi:hypothetical protein